MTDWELPENLDTVPSPGLLVDADKVDRNLKTLLSMVDGQAARLRPHVKTHKMPEIVSRYVAAGITRFKAARLSEAEMVAEAGGREVLLAYPLTGPNLAAFAQLRRQFPETEFTTIVDSPQIVEGLSRTIGSVDNPLPVFIDVDCGMHRTGIALGAALDQLRLQIEASRTLRYAGLHVYDGHLHHSDVNVRRAKTMEVITAVEAYERQRPSPEIVGGGSPTFPFWAERTAWQCSPGTTVFWDIGYGSKFPDLPFQIAAALLTRVISKPVGEANETDRLCLDLGYKSIASEKPLDSRLSLPSLDSPQWIGHSEEHLVVASPTARSIAIGQPLLAFPRHICPTVNLYAYATVVRDGQVTSERWQIKRNGE